VQNTAEMNLPGPQYHMQSYNRTHIKH